MDDFVLDTDREGRLGFPEVVYGAGKSAELLRSILREYASVEQNALATRVEPEKAAILLKAFPEATYDESSRSFMLRYNELDEKKARVGIVSAGSSDIPVVNEAFYTLNFLGEAAGRICDVGVAGIHRLMNRLDDLRAFGVLIVVAGFEGALPSVIGGLLSQPIIAVPTSTGYGAGSGGEAALRAMLSSCANGISVVNIDNGYGAAMAAFRILTI
ncbi:MAG: nickel pincer cofactor biosynthesis protein LarB [Spirochaetales bacterium]|nr:nickel pincer cofactor biosynthesis protein LarB [Spirochaetales bacterium]